MCTLDVAFVTLVYCLQVWDMQLKTGAEKSRGKGRIKLGKKIDRRSSLLAQRTSRNDLGMLFCTEKIPTSP